MRVPSLAQLSFVVMDEDIGTDDLIGQATYNVPSIRCGYRCVTLYDRRSQPLELGYLFVKVEVLE